MSLRVHYLRIYREADAILKQPDNPCQIRMEDGHVTCVKSRESKAYSGDTLCCGGCKHLGPHGCTVEALGCKLGWCWCHSPAIDGMGLADHPAFVKLYNLRMEADRLGIPRKYRASLEETLPSDS